VAVERGFRRLAIVLSCFLLFIGVAFDMIVVVPHTTVRLTLIDGRQETITVQWVGDYPTDRESLAREFSERRGVAVQASEIKNVTILRGPKYWWWGDYVGTWIAAGLIGLSWTVFYSVRWIARGFARS